MLLCDSYVIIKFLSINLFLWGHELTNSLRLLRLHSSFFFTVDYEKLFTQAEVTFYANSIV